MAGSLSQSLSVLLNCYTAYLPVSSNFECELWSKDLNAWIQDKIDDMYFKGQDLDVGTGLERWYKCRVYHTTDMTWYMKCDRGLCDMGCSLQVDTQDDDVGGDIGPSMWHSHMEYVTLGMVQGI